MKRAGLTLLTWLSFCGSAFAAEFEPVVVIQHTSDLFRGCPLHCGEKEPTQEYYAVGVTISLGERRRWEIDLTTGAKSLNHPTSRPQFESGSQVSVRWYPKR